MKELAEFLDQHHDYENAVNVVKANCSGRVWLIGGAVYRSLAFCTYEEIKPQLSEFDFIIENPNPKLVIPRNWILRQNRYGNPKLSNGFQIDFIPINSIDSILRRKLQPTIENFLTGTPLTVQSICYDVDTKRVIGEIGVKAVMEKTVSINNYEQAKVYSLKKQCPIEEIIKQKAESLGFNPVF